MKKPVYIRCPRCELNYIKNLVKITSVFIWLYDFKDLIFKNYLMKLFSINSIIFSKFNIKF